MAKFILSAFADEASTQFDGQIKALKENGITHIEPRFVEGKGILTLSEEELISVKEKLDKAGIKVGSLGSPIGKFDIEGNFDEQLCELEKAIRACELLGTNRMRMFSFFVPRENLYAYREEVIRRLTVMVKIASERGIKLCHENEEKIYGQNPEDVADLLSSVEGLLGIFDAANYCVVGADAKLGLEATLPKLEYMHVKDGLMKGKPGTEGGMVILPAGEGDGNIGDAIDRINEERDGEVILTLEPHLFSSDAFKGVDDRTLKQVCVYENEREAFDAGVLALKRVLCERGYEENSGVYTKKQ